MKALIPVERIENKILLLRGQKVMIDYDLAELYGVETRALKQAVRRNIYRFPEDFMFKMSNEEARILRSQSVTLRHGEFFKYPPMCFTEQGVAMLSCVLRSKRAVEVNIQIVRAFVKLRQLLASHEEIRRKIEEHDNKISVLFDTVRQLMAPPPVPPKRKIGF